MILKFNLPKWIYIFIILFPIFTKAYVAIDVGKAYIRESQMAIQPLVLSGPSSKPAIEAGATIFAIIKENLSSSSYFKLIEQEAFLEKPGEKKLEPYPEDPDGFIWKNWQLLNADYLVLSRYSFKENTIHLHLYLYHVPLKRKVFQKKYIADLKLVEKLSHKMCNDIIASLTKKPGIFLTKIVATRTTTGSKKELFIMNWNGKNQKQISFHNSAVLSPSWSNDGRYIAYTSFLYRKSKKSRNASLILYDRSNGNRRIISKKDGAHLGIGLFTRRKTYFALFVFRKRLYGYCQDVT